MRVILISISIALLLVACSAGLYLLNVQKNTLPNPTLLMDEQKITPDDREIAPPIPDVLHSQETTIGSHGGTLTVRTAEGVMVTLTVPAGALTKTTTIQLIPLTVDANPETLHLGAIVMPATLPLQQPLSLTFDLSKSPLKNIAPELADGNARFTGNAAIYRFAPKRQGIQLIPVVRTLETSHLVPGRIVQGGAYYLSLQSSRSEALARVALADTTGSLLTAVEGALFLLGRERNLSPLEKEQAIEAGKALIKQPNLAPEEAVATRALLNAFGEQSEKEAEQPCSAVQPPDQLIVRAALAHLNGQDSLRDSCNAFATATARSFLTNDTSASESADLYSLFAREQQLRLIVPSSEQSITNVMDQQTASVNRFISRIERDSTQEATSAGDIITALERSYSRGIDRPETHDRLRTLLLSADSFEPGSEDVHPIDEVLPAIIGRELIQSLFSPTTLDKETIASLSAQMEEKVTIDERFREPFCAYKEVLGVTTVDWCASAELDTKGFIESILVGINSTNDEALYTTKQDSDQEL